jgi:hypothetical protein
MACERSPSYYASGYADIARERRRPDSQQTGHDPAHPEVVAVVPEPSTTRGEARAVSGLAADRGWREILVVTSTYHLPRARLIFRRRVVCQLAFVSAGCPRRPLPIDLSLEIAKSVLPAPSPSSLSRPARPSWHTNARGLRMLRHHPPPRNATVAWASVPE